jgi:beta-lactamase class A
VIEGFVVIPAVGVKMITEGTAKARSSATAPRVVHAVAAPRARAVVATPAGPPAPASPAPARRPSLPALEAASAYLATRQGQNAFAVIDADGRLEGINKHQTFTSASVIKAMLLVAYLHELAAKRQTLDASPRALLDPMIRTSDNRAATAVSRLVGDSALIDVAHRAGMTEFSLGSNWANEQISAADQVRLFFRLDGLIPARYQAYARVLLSSIDPSESWGIPAVARPDWRVFFKGGWRRTGLGHLVHQVARLERPGTTFELAVMTDGTPSEAYGIETIQGVTSRLLGRSPR